MKPKLTWSYSILLGSSASGKTYGARNILGPEFSKLGLMRGKWLFTLDGGDIRTASVVYQDAVATLGLKTYDKLFKKVGAKGIVLPELQKLIVEWAGKSEKELLGKQRKNVMWKMKHKSEKKWKDKDWQNAFLAEISSEEFIEGLYFVARKSIAGRCSQNSSEDRHINVVKVETLVKELVKAKKTLPWKMGRNTWGPQLREKILVEVGKLHKLLETSHGHKFDVEKPKINWCCNFSPSKICQMKGNVRATTEGKPYSAGFRGMGWSGAVKVAQVLADLAIRNGESCFGTINMSAPELRNLSPQTLPLKCAIKDCKDQVMYRCLSPHFVHCYCQTHETIGKGKCSQIKHSCGHPVRRLDSVCYEYLNLGGTRTNSLAVPLELHAKLIAENKFKSFKKKADCEKFFKDCDRLETLVGKATLNWK